MKSLGETEKIIKEHNVLIENIISLKIDCKSNSKTRFNRALDFLKAIVNILDIQKLYKEFINGHMITLNDRVNTPFSGSRNNSDDLSLLDELKLKSELESSQVSANAVIDRSSACKSKQSKNTRTRPKH